MPIGFAVVLMMLVFQWWACWWCKRRRIWLCEQGWHRLPRQWQRQPLGYMRLAQRSDWQYWRSCACGQRVQYRVGPGP